MRSRTSTTRPRLDTLEDRTLMSTCHVTRFGDAGIGMGFRGDLRYCINKVNSVPGPDAIDFKVIGNTIFINSPLPELASDIDIQGPGKDAIWISRNGVPNQGPNMRIFKIASGANVQIAGLTIINGRIAGGGNDGRGAGIHNAGNLTLRDSVVNLNEAIATSNTEARGGGIYNSGSLTVIRTSVIDNTISSTGNFVFGGGICNEGTLFIDSTTVGSNKAIDSQSYGGGIANLDGGTMVIRNSTIAHNKAAYGGGIYAVGSLSTITHSTLARNLASDGGGLFLHSSAIAFLRNTIVADNSADFVTDLNGAIASQGHNLISDSESGSGYHSTDILDVDPVLGPLDSNGGPTQTLALLSGSPAIDAGDNADAPEWDQRGPGFPRIVNGTIDIGAFEVQSSAVPSSKRPAHEIVALILTTADLESLSF